MNIRMLERIELNIDEIRMRFNGFLIKPEPVREINRTHAALRNIAARHNHRNACL
jgi:hypothetical protein